MIHLKGFGYLRHGQLFACLCLLKLQKRPLKLDKDDRTLVLPPGSTEAKAPEGFFTELNDWLINKEAVYPRSCGGLVKFLKTHPAVENGAEAPWSSMKGEVIPGGPLRRLNPGDHPP